MSCRFNRVGRCSKAEAEANGRLRTSARWQQTRIAAIIVRLAPLSQAIDVNLDARQASARAYELATDAARP
jgi:hypothetical protein